MGQLCPANIISIFRFRPYKKKENPRKIFSGFHVLYF